MTATPAYWISNSLLAVEDVLANSAGLRAILAAGDVAAARAKTYWQVTRAGLSAPYCLLTANPGTVRSSSLRVPEHLDQIDAYLVWAPTVVGGDTDKDKAIRACNELGLALAEIADLIGTGTYLAQASMTFDPPQPCPDNGPDAGYWDATITFSWEI